MVENNSRVWQSGASWHALLKVVAPAPALAKGARGPAAVLPVREGGLQSGQGGSSADSDNRASRFPLVSLAPMLTGALQVRGAAQPRLRHLADDSRWVELGSRKLAGRGWALCSTAMRGGGRC